MKQRTTEQYISELKRMIKQRTGAECEPWLIPQVRATAQTLVLLDKVTAEIEAADDLVQLVPGSQGQMKTEVNPLLPYFDKLQARLLLQYEALGLNYNTTPRKVTENTKRGGEETDRLGARLDKLSTI